MKHLTLFIIFFSLLCTDVAKAQYTDLVDFTDYPGADQGSAPEGSLTLSGGLFYGMTTAGGASGYGVIFSYNPVGNIYTELVNFTLDSGSYPGANPYGSLTLSGGLLYGMTSQGGANGFGNIFSYDPVGNVYTDLVDFTGLAGAYPGADPHGSLTLSGGILYGMTAQGGTNEYGVLFSYDPVGNVYTDLFNFTGATGTSPGGALTYSGGLLYGMARNGGAHEYGVIFSFNPVGNVYTDLVDFTGDTGTNTGGYPYGSLTLSGSLFYGMAGIGVLFSYDPVGNVYTDLVDFTGLSGAYPGSGPVGSLTLSGSLLYGMTTEGGASDDGVIFSYNPVGNVYTELVNFTNTGAYPGAIPDGSLTSSGGVFYGMARNGGANGDGVIFSFSDTAIIDTASSINNITTSAGTGINLFPDPNHGSFTIRISSATNEPAIIIITNILDEKVKELTTTTNTDTQIILDQPPGNYFVTALTGDQKLTEKIVVE